MAIFSQEEKSNGEVETIIGPSVRVEGNFRGEGNITVQGVVQGTLKNSHNLNVGAQAKIKADVETKNLFLAGEIKGNVKVLEKTDLKSTAKILGNLETKKLSVEEGAIINGKCMMIPETMPINESKKGSAK